MLLLRDAGSGPAHSPTDDWTRPGPTRFLLSSLSKMEFGKFRESSGNSVRL